MFSQEHPRWGIRELARALDMNAATVSRMVTTLHAAGFLEQDALTQRYALGPSLVKLANRYVQQNPLPAYARKTFESFADQFEHNFYFGTLRGYHVIYLAVLDGRGRIKVVVEPGGSTGLHSTALGKVLLAYQTDSFIETFLEENGLDPHTANSISSAAELWAQIHAIRRDGIAVNDGEHFEDIAAVAAPVFNRHHQVIAGVSLAYPRNLFGQGISLDMLIPLVREIAQLITTYAVESFQNSATQADISPLLPPVFAEETIFARSAVHVTITLAIVTKQCFNI
ncbi:MAG: IclR family transcriptional regulator [Chloroflexi bacterium]|nr:IclR family transcriptional regulator [Chloroflexota bacterium]